MTLFVDASALVAIITGEPDGLELAMLVRDDSDPIWSPMSAWETVSALCRSYSYTIENSRREVADIAAARPFRLITIGTIEAEFALDAYQQYGKGRHPAALNMGDCFAYACAKANNAKLLYKGNDFAMTDLA
ncbi:ribonuclease VapC [Sphingomonas sp. UYAg733]